MTIPLPITPGRSGFTPQLQLSYDTGLGDGEFGMGFSIGLPSITRRTDRGCPIYDDQADADTFVLSESEDLVPFLTADGHVAHKLRTIQGKAFDVVRYRMRIEGMHAKIERWTKVATGEAHWRTISRDNVTTFYGRTERDRIADPTDSRRVLTWLISESFDSLGNAISYKYEAENSEYVDVHAAHERNRSDVTRAANRYLVSVRYGNTVSHLDTANSAATDWLFQLAFDYGDYDENDPRPSTRGRWKGRDDPFSTYRGGFEVRTYRLCRRILMFHHFPEEPSAGPECLVRSLSLKYAGSHPGVHDPSGPRAGQYLRSATLTGYRNTSAGAQSRSMPPLELDYTRSGPGDSPRVVEAEGSGAIQPDLGDSHVWADIEGVGIPGLLSYDEAGRLSFAASLGQGRLAPTRILPTRPSASLADPGTMVMDLAGDGSLDMVVLDDTSPGFFERSDPDGWSSYTPFTELPAIDWSDPDLRFVDVDGDGLADVLITCDDSLVWHPSLGERGFGAGHTLPAAADDESGPRVLFSSPDETIHLADFSGDGLSDIVRIRPGEICYWPSLGLGRFGPKVTMDDPPVLDRAEQFDPRRVILADTDGTGPADLIYLGERVVTMYANQLGNRWSAAVELRQVPPGDDLTEVSVTDILGTGTPCLVMSSPLPRLRRRQVDYLELYQHKPHLLCRVVNNMGGEVEVHYESSTRFYLDDLAAGRAWIDRLPFPVHVVKRVVTTDAVSRNVLVNEYAYHHGCWSPDDREFRGFAVVEQLDAERIGSVVGQQPGAAGLAPSSPPVMTRTWFHTGTTRGPGISRQLGNEYYPLTLDPSADPSAWTLADSLVPAAPASANSQEATRALRGQVLREEVYALDGTPHEVHPYSIVERSYTVEALQQPSGDRHGVFTTHRRETANITCERDRENPRISHELILEVEPFGAVTHSVEIAYGRAAPDFQLPASVQDAQRTTLVTETRISVTNMVDVERPDARDDYRIPVPWATTTERLSGSAIDGVRTRLSFDEVITLTMLQNATVRRQLVGSQRTTFLADDLSGALPPGTHAARGLSRGSQRLAFTQAMVAQTFGARAVARDLAAAGYVRDGDRWWSPSGEARYAPAGSPDPEAHAARHFFRLVRFVDPFGAETLIEYDRYDLAPIQTTDPLGNRVTAGLRNAAGRPSDVRFDYHVLSPSLVTDVNENATATAYDSLGLVAATAVMGKAGDETGDRVAPSVPDVTDAGLQELWAAPAEHGAPLLGDATTRVVYDLDAYRRTAGTDNVQPCGVATISREAHVSAPAGGRTLVTFGYFDGSGELLQHKLPAESAPRSSAPRWVGSGWTVKDNKGRVVRHFEPFFSSTNRFEFAVMRGVSPVNGYDPVGRLVATVYPDHSWEKVTYRPWDSTVWDRNDTVSISDPRADADVGAWLSAVDRSLVEPTWAAARLSGDLGPDQQDAAEKALLHAATTATTALDPRGRVVYTTVLNRTPARTGPAIETAHRHQVELDSLGDQLTLTDWTSDQVTGVTVGDRRVIWQSGFDLARNRIVSESLDGGTRRQLFDVLGREVIAWEARGGGLADRVVRTSYDALRRPVDVLLTEAPSPEMVVLRTRYGESAASPTASNLRGRVWTVFDQAGTQTMTYTRGGQVARSTRRFTADQGAPVDWSQRIPLAPGSFTSSTAYDALDRPVQETHPDGSTVRNTFNAAGLLEAVSARLPGAAADTSFVTGVEYDAKGARTKVTLGNGVVTTYGYDSRTFRLSSVKTRRVPPRAADRPRAPDTRTGVQDLGYSYDPVGNVTRVRDAAQPRVFGFNTMVDASCDYTYDALYRLVAASGREHLGQSAGRLRPPGPTTWSDSPHISPNDPQALGRYRESYSYDAAGNLQLLRHRGSSPARPGWTRTFEFQDPSELQAARRTNRVTSVRTGGTTGALTYDAAGNVTSLPNLPIMTWDHADRLSTTSRQTVAAGIPETTYYEYDAQGQRARKTTRRAAASRAASAVASERVYVGDFELFRVFDTNGAVTLSRTSLHIADGADRLATVEIRTDPGHPEQLTRYQFGNLIGSVTVELDERARFVSYEEYYPFGSTALLVAAAGVPPKRYRMSAKERDEESGLSYFGARYYAPWLCRWMSPDPAGVADGLNLYVYARDNPVTRVDPDGRESDFERAAGLLRRVNEAAPKYEAVRQAAAANRLAAQKGDRATASREWDRLKQELVKHSNEGMKIAFTVWAFMALAVASGVTGGLAAEAVIAASATPAAPALGVKMLAGAFGGIVGGSVDVAGEQALRGFLGERMLTPLEVTGRVAISGAIPVAAEGVAAGLSKLTSLIRAALPATKAPGGALAFETIVPKMKSVGSMGTPVTELEAVHIVKPSGFPNPDEFAIELAAHKNAIQDIIDREGVAGLQARIAEYRANKEAFNQLRSEINGSLGPAGPGLVHSHHPDMVIGADPFAIGRAADARVNSIIGAASKQWAEQIMAINAQVNPWARISLKAIIVW